jgi:Na+/proline symporter
LLIIPLAVQWWSTWYPGAEPGGGGYIAQRMLSAKNEKHATWATLFFNVAHYAIRPWPWLLVGLASLVVFPDLASINATFPKLSASMQGEDVAYAAMMTYLPSGLLGIVLLSLMAAFMSTISTQLNWGSSYIVNDFYKRFLKPEASDKEQVLVGRLSTIVLMILAAVFSFFLQSAGEVLNLLLQIGAGTGLLFILRWFWHKINPWSEIAAMALSFMIAAFFFVNNKMAQPLIDLPGHWQLVSAVFITTIGWILVTLITKPSSPKTMASFNDLIFGETSKFKGFNKKIISFLSGVIGVYALLFSIGSFIYGHIITGVLLLITAAVMGFIIYKSENKSV